MMPVDAKYGCMNDMLDVMQINSSAIGREVSELRERLRPLGISWIGAANDEYMRRLMEDLNKIELLAVNMCVMQELLKLAINGYQNTEVNVNMLIGEMKI